jgi:HNH/Endo VII superfamily nuclease toxins
MKINLFLPFLLISSFSLSQSLLNTAKAASSSEIVRVEAVKAPDRRIAVADNRTFSTRLESLNAIKDRGGIPRSQQFVAQWEVGIDTSRASQTNYVLDNVRNPNKSTWGKYYLYRVASKYLVVADHTDDPNSPCPSGWSLPCRHFHVGGSNNSNAVFLQSSDPDAAATSYFKTQKYDQINGDHHYFYKGI